jgi:ABC-2 type transport system permease protein
MSTILWGPLPVFTLTVRQFAGGKAIRVVAVLAAIPILFGAIYAINPDIEVPGYYLAEIIYRGIFVATLLPITVLILATGALGNEVEDHTLPYLTLKPISRLRIVLEKYVAILIVATPLILAGLLITYLLVFQGASGDRENLNYLWSMWASAAAGIIAYGAVFLLVSLLVTRALLAGITYALVWESLLGRYLPGLRLASIGHYTDSIFVGLLDDPDIALSDATRVTSAVITILAVAAVSLALATWRLRRLNLE